jgi:hypothetical protein
MTRVPVLTEAVLRAWGLDDPRVLPMLRHENQPGPNRRAKAVGERARAAGWPTTKTSTNDANKAALETLLRLEGMAWDHRAQSRRGYRGFNQQARA